MKKPHKTFFNWSSGKDAAFGLYRMLNSSDYHVSHLLTTVNRVYNRVSMHGLHRTLLEQQVAAIQLPHSTIELGETPDMEAYEHAMHKGIQRLLDTGYTHAAFGDIFLDDLRQYREKQLAKHGLKAVFPLWGEDTQQLVYSFINAGFKAIVVCVNGEKLDASFAGRVLDEQFVKDLPPGVDPCGENGEFHTFCYDGPLFEAPVAFKVGEKVCRSYTDPDNHEKSIPFWYCDLLPISNPTP
jgi:uncharacterized protein (TIGR00290 family)